VGAPPQDYLALLTPDRAKFLNKAMALGVYLPKTTFLSQKA
jgi:hypothetical protein